MKLFMTSLAVLGLSIGVGLSMTGTQLAASTDTDGAVQGLPAAAGFTLTDTEGNEHSLSDFHGQYVVLEWINDGCPFVKKFYESGKMQELQNAYTEQGVVWLSIASSASGNQGYHDAAGWNQIIADWDIASTGVLLDPSGEVGHLYDAKTTPHMIIVNPDGKKVYDGAIDSVKSTDSADIAEAQNYVEQVLDAVLLKTTVPYGCSVKY